MEKLEYIFDTQMLVEGENAKPEMIKSHLQTLDGDCLLVVGDDGLVKIHFHTNKPWEVLEFCNTCGTVYDIVVENMQKQQEEFNN